MSANYGINNLLATKWIHELIVDYWTHDYHMIITVISFILFNAIPLWTQEKVNTGSQKHVTEMLALCSLFGSARKIMA